MPLTDSAGHKILLADYTWTELEDIGQKEELKFILPLGSTEEHGPHLTLDMDTFAIVRIAEQAAAHSTGCIVMPELAYGHCVDTASFCGTIHLSASTFQACLLDIAASVYRHGFRKLVLLNGHGGNTAPAQTAAREVLMHLAGPASKPVTDFGIHYYPLPYQPVREKVLEVMDSHDYGHACEAETSVVLALDKSKVFMDKAGEEYLDGDEDTRWRPRDMKTAAPSGVHGAPRYATSAKGEQILEAMVDRLAGFLDKI